MPLTAFPLAESQKSQFEQNGFIAISNLLSEEETNSLRDHFMALHQEALAPEAPVRDHYKPMTLEDAGGDKLKHFPRIMNPAHFDELARNTMLSERLGSVLSQLIEETPLAAQSMFYFKPPGAKGQALHQDNFYLNVTPGTCIAAWIALDPADEENGGMFMVPGSHQLPVLCPHLADMEKSFTTEEVDIPTGMEAVQVPLKAGDVLFFTGSVIHGSYPNTSQNRFRRAFICHYVGDSTNAMNAGYYPLWNFNGQQLRRDSNEGGSHTCGNEEWEQFQAAIARFRPDHKLQSGGGH